MRDLSLCRLLMATTGFSAHCVDYTKLYTTVLPDLKPVLIDPEMLPLPAHAILYSGFCCIIISTYI